MTRNSSTIARLATATKAIVDGLPTDAERSAAIGYLDKVIKFLTDVRSAVSGLPTQEAAAPTSEAVSRLRELLEKAEADESLSLALTMRRRQRAAAGSVGVSDGRAQELLSGLEQLDPDDLRVRLDNPAISSAELRAVAALLGIKTSQRTSRRAIQNQVASRIANDRGYDLLRRGTSPPVRS